MIDLDKCSVNGLKEIIKILDEQRKNHFDEWMRSSQEVGFFRARANGFEEENLLLKKQLSQNVEKQPDRLRIIPLTEKRMLN